MTILPNTVYEYDYLGSRFLTCTLPQIDSRTNEYWACDIQRLSGNEEIFINPWEFEYCIKSSNVTIIQCYDQQNYPEYYI